MYVYVVEVQFNMLCLSCYKGQRDQRELNGLEFSLLSDIGEIPPSTNTDTAGRLSSSCCRMFSNPEVLVDLALTV